jgi:hypothetical protein
MKRFALSLAFLFAACTTPPPQPLAPPQAFGPWLVPGCMASARAADVWLTTTGSLTFSGKLEFRASFTPPLVRPPFATIAGLPLPIGVEGTNRVYNLFVPYSPESGAHFLQSSSYLTLSYQPLGSPAIQDVSFPTAPLMQALAALKGCD